MKHPLVDPDILQFIPQQPPFRFVDEIHSLDENTSTGSYYFKKEEYFYQGHFPDLALTPSVILIETMAQIGLIPLGIMNYLQEHNSGSIEALKPIFTDSNVKFIKPVFPETKVIVEAKKVYFRMNRLKAQVKLFNEQEELCSSGVLSGLILNHSELSIE